MNTWGKEKKNNENDDSNLNAHKIGREKKNYTEGCATQITSIIETIKENGSER